MAELEKFNQIASRFASVADFVIVYIREAHADDGWDFASNPYKISQATDLKERIEAAKILKELDTKLQCPILVDLMSDEARIAYDALPERLYILQDNTVALKGKPGPMGYDTVELEAWLQAHAMQKQK